MAKTFKPENGSRQNFNSLFARLSALEAGHTRLMDRVTQLYTELFTQQETIAAIRTHENEDRAALVALVDGGAKNHALETDKTGTRFFSIDVRPITGKYRFVIGQYASTDTDTNNFIIIFRYSDGTDEIKYYPKNADINYEYTTNKYLIQISVYASATYNQSDGDTVSVSNLMICTAADYAISHAFVPYRPSWQEMWTMIQALQSGGASTQSVQPALMSAAKAETQQREEDDTDA